MSSGILSPRRSISFATVIISSSDGVMRPDRPRTSALCSFTAAMIFATGHITPRSTTLKLLHPRTTPTMFLPMSCTSPFTVAMTTVPLYMSDSGAVAGSIPSSLYFFARSSSMNGMRCATAFFMTRADLMTCGKNILPAPKRSPTVDMPAMRGPSITFSGCGYVTWSERASSVSATTYLSLPSMSDFLRRSCTDKLRHSSLTTFFFASGPIACA
mmetsp:Transcript_4916/g.12722  ORF Transcript_4916/g.12722 Transcript_4916/m.12722 type:complete len:214 (+) Transcript_4916:1353-1994(+)